MMMIMTMIVIIISSTHHVSNMRNVRVLSSTLALTFLLCFRTCYGRTTTLVECTSVLLSRCKPPCRCTGIPGCQQTGATHRVVVALALATLFALSWVEGVHRSPYIGHCNRCNFGVFIKYLMLWPSW